MNTTAAASLILVCLYIVCPCPSTADLTTTTATTLTETSATTAAAAGFDDTSDNIAAATTAAPFTLDSLSSPPDSLESLAAMLSSYPGMQQQLSALKQTLQANPTSSSAAAAGAPIGSPQASSGMTPSGVFPPEVQGVQSAANFNLGLGNNGQTRGFISQIIESVLQRILGNGGSTNTQPQPIPAPQVPVGSGSTSPFGFGNMFNPFGFFGGSAMNPFGMLWPTMMFDAIDFI